MLMEMAPTLGSTDPYADFATFPGIDALGP